MRMKTALIPAAVLLITAAFTGCSKNDSGSTVKKNKDAAVNSSQERVAEVYKDVEDISSGAVLSISHTEAAPGERAEVTISVENSGDPWNICGLHFIYPDALECLSASPDNPDLVKYELGDACEDFALASSMKWIGEIPEDLEGKGMDIVFFAAGATADDGGSGDIATFYFDIPEGAEPGTEYPFDFYYCSTDQFTNVAGDKAMEKYAFTHWQGGSVTVK